MKQKQQFPKYIEFARCANEGVADLSENIILDGEHVGHRADAILNDIPIDEAKRSDFDWLALFLYYLFTVFCRRDANFYRDVLNELDTVKTEEQIKELLEIEEEYAAVELVGYEDQWARLEMIKKLIREYPLNGRGEMRDK